MADFPDSITHHRATIETIVASLFLALTWSTLLLRLWTRSYFAKGLGWDDILISIAVSMFTVSCASLIKVAEIGLHFSTLDAACALVRWHLVNEVFYSMNLFVLKLSLGFFFLRIVSSWRRYLVYFVMALSGIVYFSHANIWIFLCGWPTNYAQKYLFDKCLPRHVALSLLYEQSAISIFTDSLLILLPMTFLKKFQMAFRTKLAVGFVFLVASIAIASVVVRTLYLHNLVYISSTFSYAGAANTAVFSLVEPGAGIIAANLAVLGPLLERRQIHPLPSAVISRSKSARSDYSRRLGSISDRHTKSVGSISAAMLKSNIDEVNWDPRVWEGPDPRKRARTTTTCVAHPRAHDGALELQKVGLKRSESTEKILPQRQASQIRRASRPDRNAISLTVNVDIDIDEGHESEDATNAVSQSFSSDDGLDSWKIDTKRSSSGPDHRRSTPQLQDLSNLLGLSTSSTRSKDTASEVTS